MLIAEESDRKRREKQKKGYPPKWGDHTLTRMRVGHAARQLNFQHAPSAQAADPREPFVFLMAVFMRRGARVMWSRGLYFRFNWPAFSFRAFRLLQGSVLCFDASGAVVELRVLGNGDCVSWCSVLLARRVVIAQVFRCVGVSA